MAPLALGIVRIYTARPGEFRERHSGELMAWLDPAEQARAARFRFAADRQAFVLVHALRRRVIANALAVAPDQLRFEETPDGQPRLAAPQAHGLYFSHSRTRGGVAVALTRIAPIGIDLESPDRGSADRDLLQPYVAPCGATHDFLRDWTALEAYWKAAGTGLASSNPRIVLREAGQGIAELRFEHDEPCRIRARIFRFDLLAPAAMAVALDAHDATSAEWQVLHCNSSMEIDGSSGPVVPRTSASGLGWPVTWCEAL